MKQILIVDDDNAIREALNKVLESEGYKVLQAADSMDALEKFNDGAIDIIVLDLNLPGKSGWDLFETFTGSAPLVPVVIITGRPDQKTLAAAAGAGALFEKPLDVDLLLRTIAELLVQKQETRLRRLIGESRRFRFAAPKHPKERSL